MAGRIPKTYLTPQSGRPTRETISLEVGFKVPTRFSEFVCQIYDLYQGDPKSCISAFEATLGLYPVGANARYSSTPPELFPIGNTGVDGDHYGFLLLAPELDLDELPFAHYCPADDDGVCIVGSTALHGIASLMARILSYDTSISSDFLSPEEKQQIADVANACNICPEEEENPTIAVPSGWKYLPSADGVGTLAPANLFSPDHTEIVYRFGQTSPCIEAADGALKNGYFATALHYLREGLWLNWCVNPSRTDIANRMADVYHKLNRGKLAEEMHHTMRRWAESESKGKEFETG